MATDFLTMTVTAGCTASDPYTFKAKQESSTDEKSVNLVMPLGGVESGLYRSPKAGEKVFVASVDDSSGNESYYMMGYLPAADTQNFSEKKNGKETTDVIDSLGEVFRYKKTGPNEPKDDEYSEIGFYSKAADWKMEEADPEHPKINPNPPKIDQINIHSTGDIYESAVNYKQVKAARLELLALEEVENTKTNPADDFAHGDINISAEGSITIKAGESITLKVGRTKLVISDEGFSVTNQLMSALPNPVDAKISMNAREGVSIAGQTVGISADRKWSLGDKFGAGISGVIGVLNVTGREIDLSTAQWSAQLASNIAYGLDYISKVTAGGIALNSYSDATKRDSQYIANEVLTSAKLLSNWLFLVFKYYASPKLIGTSKLGEINDYNRKAAGVVASAQNPQNLPGFEPSPAEMILKAANTEPYMALALTLDLLLEMTESIYATLEWTCGFEGTDLDKFNFSTLVVDQGLTLILTSIMVGLNHDLDGNAELNMGYDGETAITSATKKEFYAEAHEKGAATATLLPKWALWAGVATSAIGELTKDLQFVQSSIANAPTEAKGEEETL